MFGLFADWNDKKAKSYSKMHPWLETVSVGSAIVFTRVLGLQEHLNSLSGLHQSHDVIQRQLAAFYLGVAEGDVRQSFNMATATQKDIIDRTLAVFIYSVIKLRQVRNNAELDDLLKKCTAIIFNEDLIWFRRQGIAFSGAFRDDPEAMWREMVENAVDERPPFVNRYEMPTDSVGSGALGYDPANAGFLGS